MRYKDSGLHFGIVSVLGHWVGGAAFLAFLISACVADIFAPKFMPAHTLALWTSVLVLPASAFRLYWRIANYHPAPLGGANPAQVLVGRGIALGMLLAGVVLPAMYWIKEVLAVTVSWWLTPLFWVGAACFCCGLALHLYGAFTHVFVLKDASLKRMLGYQIDL